MTRFDAQAFEKTMAAQRGTLSCDVFFEMALACSTGRDGTADLITAHKWFNIAAIKGKREAARYRQEIAREMTAEQVAEAQRAAREWLNCA